MEITTKIKAEIIERYAAGEPVLKIASTYGVSEFSIRGYCRGVDRHMTCKCCGKKFKLTYGEHARFYCDKCQKSAPPKSKPKRTIRSRVTLDDTVRAAQAAGMSYGQYVLMRDYLHKEV